LEDAEIKFIKEISKRSEPDSQGTYTFPAFLASDGVERRTVALR
jgi:hypothetical protein